MKPVIEFNNISKHYYLGSRRAYINYLLPEFIQRWLENGNRSSDNRPDKSEEFWALKDVSFKAHQSEVVGIIGPNGAGKTTILSLLAGIISPTSGEIGIRGRVGALIQLGAGFHPDLTGRENVFLNGSILGLRRSEIEALYDDIVEFSGLEDFMDTPVKRYSSGMYVRLGFATAVHIDPDVLLVDEILSVGDVSFQARCLNRIGEIQEAGTTVVFVSHNMHHVASFCDRVIYLKHGQIQCMGEPGEAIGAYTTDLMEREAQTTVFDGSDMNEVNGTGRMVITDVVFLDQGGNEVEQIRSGDPVTMRIFYRGEHDIENPVLDVVIRDAARGNMYQATNRDFGVEFGRVGRRGHFDITFKSIPSNNQVLNFFLTLWNANHTERFDWKRFIPLQVMGRPTTSGRFLFETEWQIKSQPEGNQSGEPRLNSAPRQHV